MHWFHALRQITGAKSNRAVGGGQCPANGGSLAPLFGKRRLHDHQSAIQLQLGDTILGLLLQGLWGLGLPSSDLALALDSVRDDRGWHHGFSARLDAADSLSISLPRHSRSREGTNAKIRARTVTAPTAETASEHCQSWRAVRHWPGKG
jgi:hypothetical protein